MNVMECSFYTVLVHHYFGKRYIYNHYKVFGLVERIMLKHVASLCNPDSEW